MSDKREAYKVGNSTPSALEFALKIKKMDMEAAVATKFVKWEVPTLESLHECKVYRLRMKVNNGDATALTDDEVLTIDRWMKQWQVQDVSPLTDEEGNAQPYFTHYSLFGLPTEVEDCEILYLNDNPTKI